MNPTIVDDDRHIGAQVAAIRLRRGLTQQILADRIGVSRGAVAKYENGERPIDSRRTLYALAEALEVSVADLTGHPEDKQMSAASVFHSAVPRIEAALLSAGNVADVRSPLPVEALTAAADRALDLRMAGDLSCLGPMLPDLITDCWRRTVDGPESERVAAWSALGRAAFATAMASKSLGYTSLPWTAATVTARAADVTGDKLALAAAEFAASQVLLAMPEGVPASLLRAQDAVDRLDNDLATSSEGAQLLGMLHLQAALTSAALGRDAGDHLAEAVRTAVRTGEDGAAWQLGFGPLNVDIWSMSVAMEEGRPGAAVELAEGVDPNAIVLAERKARFFVEVGRGHAMEGRFPEAMAALLRAEVVAPQYVRSRAVVRELVAYMLRRARRDLASGDLGRLAARVGAIPQPKEGGSGSA